MKYLNDITEDKLKAGWIYKFNNQKRVLTGNCIEILSMKLTYEREGLIFVLRLNETIIEMSHDFETILKTVVLNSKRYNLELRSMKRSTIPKHIISSSN